MDDVYLSSYVYSFFKRQLKTDGVEVFSIENGKTVVSLNNRSFEFTLSRSPFNSSAAITFCDDKAQVYRTRDTALPVPFTEVYNKGDVPMAEILQKIQSESHPFDFPLIVKPNEGTMSRQAYIATNEEELKLALEANISDTDNGKSILIQQCIEGAKEYRAICLNGECVFAYEKSGYVSGECVNPIYQPDSNAVIETDQVILQRISEIAKHLKDTYDVTYTGLDVFLQDDGSIFLIDVNSAPCGLRKVVIDCGDEPIQKLCGSMLHHMQALSQPRFRMKEELSLQA